MGCGGPGPPGLRLGAKRGRVSGRVLYRVEDVGVRRETTEWGWRVTDSQVGGVSQAPLGRVALLLHSGPEATYHLF